MEAWRPAALSPSQN